MAELNGNELTIVDDVERDGCACCDRKTTVEMLKETFDKVLAIADADLHKELMHFAHEHCWGSPLDMTDEELGKNEK